jgi:hypothetical protein
MTHRTLRYFSKARALKILERPLQSDLQTLLSATFAISQSSVVKKHIKNTLHELRAPVYGLTA